MPEDAAGTHHWVFRAMSGAGKSSLLECLCLRNRNFVGALHWHGKPVTSDYYMQAAMV